MNPSPEIDITNTLRKYRVREDLVEQLARRIIDHLAISERVGIELLFVGSKKIAELNYEFRNKPTPTDVLSFPMMDFSRPLPLRKKPATMKHHKGSIFLGTVVVCPDVAKRNARKIGQSLQREILFLMNHGILHLVGYDHIEAGDEKKMLKVQKHIMKGFSSPMWRRRYQRALVSRRASLKGIEKGP